MVERGRGGVLNVASTIAFQPAPYQATYGASQTAIYARLDDPGPVVDAGLRAVDRGVPVAVPGLRNQAIAFLPRIAPRRLITSISGRLLAPKAAR
jgi:short-subunit dehydrogenase